MSEHFCRMPERLESMESSRPGHALWRLEGETSLGGVPLGRLKEVIQDAVVTSWAAVAGVDGREAGPGERPDLLIRLARLDGRGGVLADCQLPGPAVQLMRVDVGESWVVQLGVRRPDGQTDLWRVLRHEAGHFWGLGHAPRGSRNLMAPVYSDSVDGPTGDWDQSEMQRLHGPPRPAAPRPPQGPPPVPDDGDGVDVGLAGKVRSVAVNGVVVWKALGVLLLSLCLGAAAGSAEPAAATPKVPGLELPEPQDVEAGGQFVELEAKTPAESVSWDVFSVFDDPKVVLKVKEGKKTLVVGVPDSPGAVRVTACAVVEGKLTRIASTVITVVPRADKAQADKAQPNAPPKARPKAAADVAGRHVTLVGARADAALRSALEALGVRVHELADLKSRPDIARRLPAARLPGLFVQDAAGRPLHAGPLPATGNEVVELVKGLP